MPETLLQELDDKTVVMLMRRNLIKSIATAEVIEQAVKDLDISEERIDNAWNSYLTENGIKNDDELYVHLCEIGLDHAALRWQIELPVRISDYSRINFSHKAEARFLAKKESLDRVVYSLLRVKDAFLARELYLRIAGNESNFSDIAATHSQGPEARTNGVVGPVAMNQAHPALAERLRTSRPGQLLEPFNIENWWIVARLEKYEPARFEESTSQAMANELFGEWVQGIVQCKIKELSNRWLSKP